MTDPIIEELQQEEKQELQALDKSDNKFLIKLSLILVIIFAISWFLIKHPN